MTERKAVMPTSLDVWRENSRSRIPKEESDIRKAVEPEDIAVSNEAIPAILAALPTDYYRSIVQLAAAGYSNEEIAKILKPNYPDTSHRAIITAQQRIREFITDYLSGIPNARKEKNIMRKEPTEEMLQALSPREDYQDILILFSLGWTSVAIAERLGKSDYTIKYEKKKIHAILKRSFSEEEIKEVLG